MNPKIYSGQRVDGQCLVTVTRAQSFAGGIGIAADTLDPRFDLRNASPTGFEWGYGGSGPAQLALALVADACAGEGFDADDYALRVHQQFKWRFVANLKRDEPWQITDEDVRAICVELCAPFETRPAPHRVTEAARRAAGLS